ncbi:hypothetical protein GFK26_12585 [Variovorax paradoxus]|uniref:Uncharacterized protein n=1 Tax=Variovorax paradoxus TaxID=34073 RepID=A0A5Q0M4Z4_VARPD|nr:hypothetical protein [Variovorax paradoxus]QFZ83535.1 hypothetical protein GFK26_12585 [Variovorax paradoxus]
MWKPTTPIVFAGRTLTDQEAWWHEFKDEFYELYEGAVDSDLLTIVCDTMHPRAFNDDPRDIARLAHAVLTYERPELAEAAHGERAHLWRTAAPRAKRSTSCRRPRR